MLKGKLIANELAALTKDDELVRLRNEVQRLRDYLQRIAWLGNVGAIDGMYIVAYAAELAGDALAGNLPPNTRPLGKSTAPAGDATKAV